MGSAPACDFWQPSSNEVLFQPTLGYIFDHRDLGKGVSMAVSMYSVSIPVFIQHLNGLNTVLDKASAWAAARKVNETDLISMRLSPDMFNLTRQVRAATDHAANAAGRLRALTTPFRNNNFDRNMVSTIVTWFLLHRGLSSAARFRR
jgi:hypothetical protein